MKLPRQRLLGSFTVLHLPSRKFPLKRMLPNRFALRDQHKAIALQNTCDYRSHAVYDPSANRRAPVARGDHPISSRALSEDTR